MPFDGRTVRPARGLIIEGPFVLGADREVAEWVRQRVKYVASVDAFGPMVALGIQRDGRLIAGAVFNNWRHPDIHITFAGEPGWATRTICRRVMAYPFEQQKCSRLTAITGDANEPAKRFLTRFGFKLEGTHPHLFPDGATGLSFGLYRETCRWLDKSND